KLDDARADQLLVIFNDPPRGMIFLRKFGDGVGKWTSALTGLTQLRGNMLDPRYKTFTRGFGSASRMLPCYVIPQIVRLPRERLNPAGDEFVLRSEVAIQRHLISARGFRDRFHADAANPMAAE